ncbi:MAG TPA: DUF4190 domain-containing protein [Jatrophihabitantaceae bacterium]|nr:DUF4190 domain-containing protein [Jatrophihabitantaceae bacterium]
MTTPPSDGSPRSDGDPVSLDKPATDESFDPYRFGAPEHPVPPEYAPPGYRPPPVTQPPAEQPPQDPPVYSGYPGYAGYGAPSPNPYQNYPGQPGYGPPPPWMTQYPPPAGQGKAVASLVLGIASILLCWLWVLDLIPIVIAVVLGAVAIGDSRRTGRGRGLAIGGIACAVVAALIFVLITVWVVPKVQDCLDSYDQNSSEFNTCVQDKFNL